MRVTSRDELHDLWPKDDKEVGKRCAELLVAFLTEKLIETAAGADCNPVSAQGESAANKTLSQLIRDFRGLVFPEKPKGEFKPTLAPLNRFRDQDPQPKPQSTA